MARMVWILLLGGLAFLIQTQAKADPVINQDVIGNGGGTVGDASHTVTGTIGQSVIGVVASETHINEIGFWYQPLQIASDVSPSDGDLPLEYFLGPGQPNPSRRTAVIVLAVPKRSRISVKLYDVTGRELKTLVQDVVEPGYHNLDLHAAGLPSGIYFCQMTAEQFTQTRRLVLLK